MSDNNNIRLRLLTGPPKAWLSLRGTILSYRAKSWCFDSTMDIPVELVTFIRKKQFMGTRLIVAFLSLLIFPGIGGATLGLWRYFAGPPNSKIITICMSTTTITGLFIFLVLLIRFFFRQETITVHVAPNDTTISFWNEAKQKVRIDNLINDVARRQTLVVDTIPYPMRFAIGNTIYIPWRRALIAAILFCIPAILTGIPWLLLAGLIPIGMQIFSSLLAVKEPCEFRKAKRHFFKQEWSQAQDLILKLIRGVPNYMPAKLFLIELKMQLGDFAGAESTLADIHNDLDSETLQAIQQDIIIRYRIAERKKDGIQHVPPAHPSGC